MVKQDVCPGCSRHCSANNVRCKFGRKHFEKVHRMKAEQTGCGQPEDNGKHRRKWEKHVLQGGLTWKFLWMGSRIKKALRRKRLTEQDVLAALSGEEQARLAALLDKLSGILG